MSRVLYRKPTAWERATMLSIIEAIESASGILVKDFSSKSRLHTHSRLRVIFGYNCRFYGIPNVVGAQMINRCHSMMCTYIEYYNRDYNANYKGFKDLADSVRFILEKNNIFKFKKVNNYGVHNHN